MTSHLIGTIRKDEARDPVANHFHATHAVQTSGWKLPCSTIVTFPDAFRIHPTEDESFYIGVDADGQKWELETLEDSLYSLKRTK